MVMLFLAFLATLQQGAQKRVQTADRQIYIQPWLTPDPTAVACSTTAVHLPIKQKGVKQSNSCECTKDDRKSH